VFHVLSSHNPPLREALYATIGFKRCPEVALPEALARRKITNPDAPVNEHYATVAHDGRPIEIMPVLISSAEQYDPRRGGNLFSYLQFRLLVLEDDNGVLRLALTNGQPILLGPNSVPGFHELIGRNTSYIIHPEEILAENFVHLINGRINLPTQRVVNEMGRV